MAQVFHALPTYGNRPIGTAVIEGMLDHTARERGGSGPRILKENILSGMFRFASPSISRTYPTSLAMMRHATAHPASRKVSRSGYEPGHGLRGKLDGEALSGSR